MTTPTIRQTIALVRRDKRAGGNGAYGTAWLSDESRTALDFNWLKVRHCHSRWTGLLLGCFQVVGDGRPETAKRRAVDV